MPNHKFINADFDFKTADALLDWLYLPGVAWWVVHERQWAKVNNLMTCDGNDLDQLVGVADAHEKYDIKMISGTHDNEPTGYLFGRRGQKLSVSIRSPQTLDAWGLSELPALLAGQALMEFERTFGTWITGAPSTTGLRMMGAMTKDDEVGGPSDLSPFEHNDAQDFIWTRELTEEEKRMPYLHAFDKRMAYLYSSDINLGIGDWVHAAPGLADDYGFDASMPGLWRVEWVDDSMRESHGCTLGGLPWPYVSRRGWYYTPMIELFKKLGMPGRIVEGYFFPKRRRVLHQWVKILTNVIQCKGLIDSMSGLHPNDKLVAQSIIKMAKRTYRTTIGLLGSNKRKDKSEWSYRPDWRGMIVSDAAARIYYGMLRVKELCGRTPAAIYMDCLYYPSSNRNPADVPALPFTTDEQLSKGYHFKGTYDLTKPGARDLFRSDGRKLNFAEKIQQFEIGGE